MLLRQYPPRDHSWGRDAKTFKHWHSNTTSIKIIIGLLLDAKKVSALWFPSIAYAGFAQGSGWWIVAKIPELQ